ALLPWNPNANSTVYALAKDGANLYIGGAFSTMSGVARSRLAAVNTSGTLQTWNPNVNSTVSALYVHTGALTIYAGGSFTSIGVLAQSYFSQLDQFTNPVPSLVSISPAGRPVGSGAFTLTVNGANFTPSSVVRVVGSNRTTTYINSTTLTAQFLANDTAIEGDYDITVANPVPGGGVSSPVTLSVGYGNLKVRLTNIPTAPSGSEVTARKIYRTSADGTEFTLLTVIGDNTTTTFEDTISDAAIAGNPAPPDVNATGLVPQYIFAIPTDPGTSVDLLGSLPLGSHNSGYYIIREPTSGRLTVGACYGEEIDQIRVSR
ncbi:MAG: IPT/TIG domain-containing protein, partial [Patescibacteria group bacterium]